MEEEDEKEEVGISAKRTGMDRRFCGSNALSCSLVVFSSCSQDRPELGSASLA